jgi:hypothetical protein
MKPLPNQGSDVIGSRTPTFIEMLPQNCKHLLICWVWGSHGGDYEELMSLGNIVSLSSVSKDKPSKKLHVETTGSIQARRELQVSEFTPIGSHWKTGNQKPVGFASPTYKLGNYCFLVSCWLLHSGGGGSKLGPLSTSATYWPIVPALGDCEDGEFGGMNGRENRSTRRKPAPTPLCPPQIPLDQTRDWTRAAAVGSQRLTASTFA